MLPIDLGDWIFDDKLEIVEDDPNIDETPCIELRSETYFTDFGPSLTRLKIC